jgi:hypothetical protein
MLRETPVHGHMLTVGLVIDSYLTRSLEKNSFVGCDSMMVVAGNHERLKNLDGTHECPSFVRVAGQGLGLE